VGYFASWIVQLKFIRGPDPECERRSVDLYGTERNLYTSLLSVRFGVNLTLLIVQTVSNHTDVLVFYMRCHLELVSV
jgi:hypothetical protein